MIAPESLAPKRRFTHDSSKSPTTEASATSNAADEQRQGHTAGEPRPGFPRADRRRQFRTADRPSGKISADIGCPDDGEQPEDRRRAVGHPDSQIQSRKRRRPEQCRTAGRPSPGTAETGLVTLLQGADCGSCRKDRKRPWRLGEGGCQ